jgi:hypothetical protein
MLEAESSDAANLNKTSGSLVRNCGNLKNNARVHPNDRPRGVKTNILPAACLFIAEPHLNTLSSDNGSALTLPCQVAASSLTRTVASRREATHYDKLVKLTARISCFELNGWRYMFI